MVLICCSKTAVMRKRGCRRRWPACGRAIVWWCAGCRSSGLASPACSSWTPICAFAAVIWGCSTSEAGLRPAHVFCLVQPPKCSDSPYKITFRVWPDEPWSRVGGAGHPRRAEPQRGARYLPGDSRGVRLPPSARDCHGFRCAAGERAARAAKPGTSKAKWSVPASSAASGACGASRLLAPGAIPSATADQPTFDTDKLVKVLGMLGSAHPGEVAAAGPAAHKLITEAGLGWQDLIKGASAR